VYGLLATACGYTYPQIDEMTMLQVYELMDYWSEYPPTHLLLRMVYKYERKKPEEISQDLSAFFRQMTGHPLPR
jgi:hypothetical protein